MAGTKRRSSFDNSFSKKEIELADSAIKNALKSNQLIDAREYFKQAAGKAEKEKRMAEGYRAMAKLSEVIEKEMRNASKEADYLLDNY